MLFILRFTEIFSFFAVITNIFNYPCNFLFYTQIGFDEGLFFSVEYDTSGMYFFLQINFHLRLPPPSPIIK